MTTFRNKFHPGQVIHHKLFDYRGVVVGVDQTFQLSEEWYEEVARSRPPKDQPWYHVLVHGARQATYVAERIREIFHNLGFSVADGPEIEDEWHNFIGLNIPPDHIARDPSENFYLVNDLLLRSQTSTVQIRVMEGRQPPLRIVAPATS